MKKLASILILISCLSACYKDPFLNDEAFMVGKWELVKIEISPFMLGGGTFPPEEQEIPFHFEFEVEKRGVWTEFVNGNKLRRLRVEGNVVEFDREAAESNQIFVSFYEFNSLDYYENIEGWYRFNINESEDTLTSISYPGSRIFPKYYQNFNDPRPVFTFAKIQ